MKDSKTAPHNVTATPTTHEKRENHVIRGKLNMDGVPKTKGEKPWDEMVLKNAHLQSLNQILKDLH